MILSKIIVFYSPSSAVSSSPSAASAVAADLSALGTSTYATGAADTDNTSMFAGTVRSLTLIAPPNSTHEISRSNDDTIFSGVHLIFIDLICDMSDPPTFTPGDSPT